VPHPDVRRMTCLDAVLARTKAIVDISRTAYADPGLSPSEMLVEPSVCEGEGGPANLMPAISPEFRTVLAIEMHAVRVDRAPDLPGDPCAAARWRARTGPLEPGDKGNQALAEAAALAERCGDDGVRAAVHVGAAALRLTRAMFGESLEAAIDLAAD